MNCNNCGNVLYPSDKLCPICSTPNPNYKEKEVKINKNTNILMVLTTIFSIIILSLTLKNKSFFEGIKKAVPGNHINDISEAIQDYVESHCYSVVRDLAGHGIGQNLHEAPDIYNFRQKTKGIKIEKNMTFAIEPMVNMGGYEVEWGEDGWTVYTADYSFSAHYENTILITNGEPEILTL